MKIQSYRIETDGSLASLEGEDWQRHRNENKALLWVHIEGGNPEQVREVLAPLGLHELILGMLEDRNTFGARIIPWDDAMLLVLPALTDETQDVSAYSAALCLENLLITFEQTTSEGVVNSPGICAAGSGCINRLPRLLCAPCWCLKTTAGCVVRSPCAAVSRPSWRHWKWTRKR